MAPLVRGSSGNYWARTSRVSIKICKICKICKFANLGEREKASGAGKRSAKTSKLYLSPLDFVVHFCTEIHFARAGDFKTVWLWSQRRPRCARTRPSRRRSRPSREGSVLFHASHLFKLRTNEDPFTEGGRLFCPIGVSSRMLFFRVPRGRTVHSMWGQHVLFSINMIRPDPPISRTGVHECIFHADFFFCRAF